MSTSPIGGRDYLGTGWKFPIRVGPEGGLSWSSGEEDVAEAIWIVLSTAKGEREMRPRFGCGIQDYVFAGDTPATRGAIAHQVREALVEWEPRIDVLDVRVEPGIGQANLLLVAVDYRIRSNNAFANLVYPFYVREGEGV